MSKKILLLGGLLALIMLAGFGCQTVSPQAQQKMKPITLNYWRVWDGPDDFKAAIAEYNKLHPNISIQYRKLSSAEYEQALVNALAEDRGPDIFSIDATWVRAYQNKIVPLPDQITMAYPVVTGTIQKQTIPQLRTQKSLTLASLKDGYVDTVYNDVTMSVYDQNLKADTVKIYALPLSFDALATFYNKDLLNNAGIAQLPVYWNKEFQQDVQKLTKQDAKGAILQAGVALGGGFNVERSSEILAALILQNGSAVINDQGQVVFRQYIQTKDYNPGIDAIRFYTDFANPTKDVYSWNKSLPDSLDMFVQGNLAIMFGYSYDVPIIKARAPKLNFAIQPFPQIEGRTDPKNVADYWVETVSKKSQYPNEAWDFIQFIAAQPNIVKTFLASTGRVSAIKSLIKDETSDENVGVFAQQLLVSTNWYRGMNYDAADKALKQMVQDIADNPDTLDAQTRLAEGTISNTINQQQQ
jgi:ABC-type glycerol-3-phosphate transport system substrate-binding protein